VALHRFASFVAACTLLLIVAGGAVTSTSSGLAVPDWPNTYGHFMFSFPIDKMVGGIFYEHGHRLIASTVGFLTIVLAVWIWKVDPRRWMRRLGWLALAAVIAQGVLGGLTVLFFLPPPISIAHAGLAEIFFCLTVCLAQFTAPGWKAGYRDAAAPPLAGVDDDILRKLSLVTLAAVYIQILLGATMRHTGAGLAIPDFPLVFGGVVPGHWTWAIGIHYAHRVGAGIVSVLMIALAGHVWYHHPGRRELKRPANTMLFVLLLQITLGGLTVLSGRNVTINTSHVATGALLLATTVVLTLRCHRVRFASDATASTAAGASAAWRADRSSAGARA